jgi:hypothetical protein
VIASVHLADVGVRSALGLLRKVPKPGAIEGVLHADIGVAKALTGSLRTPPSVGRVGLIAFWKSDDAIDRFLSGHPLASAFVEGWHTRLEPLRAYGTWPGLPADIPSGRSTEYDGPAVVLTLGRFRLRRTVPFFRASTRAEAGVVGAPGFLWGTALAKPPFVATCSLWENPRALSTYAYGKNDPAHPDAIEADKANPFHHQSAFIRFRPYAVEGTLGGKNPLGEHALAGQ